MFVLSLLQQGDGGNGTESDDKSPTLPRVTSYAKIEETRQMENEISNDDALSHTSEILIPTSLLMLSPRRHQSILEISSSPQQGQDCSLQQCSEETINEVGGEQRAKCENEPVRCQQTTSNDLVSQWLVDQPECTITMRNDEGNIPVLSSDLNTKRIMEVCFFGMCVWNYKFLIASLIHLFGYVYKAT